VPPAHGVALLTPEFLLRLGRNPGTKVLDLQGQVRCRGCGAGDEPSYRSSGDAGERSMTQWAWDRANPIHCLLTVDQA
jgi:hypothetical protein